MYRFTEKKYRVPILACSHYTDHVHFERHIFVHILAATYVTSVEIARGKFRKIRTCKPQICCLHVSVFKTPLTC